MPLPELLTKEQAKLYCLISNEKLPEKPSELHFYTIGDAEYIFAKNAYHLIPEDTLIK